MFDIGFAELLVIGVVSLIVVGPKDLPGMFRTVGKYVGKAKGMAREFQRSMEDAADASGLSDVTKDFKDMASGLDDLKDIGNMAKPGMSGAKAAKKNFDKIVKAKEAGIPIDDDSEAADDLAAIAAEDLVDDDPAPIIEIVEDEPPAKAAKPKAKPKPKAKVKPKAKPKAKAESPET